MTPLPKNIHLYHYHYLYSGEPNHPRTITETKMCQDPDTERTHYHHHVYTILKLKEHTQKTQPSTPKQGNILELPPRFPEEVINSPRSQIIPPEEYFREQPAIEGLLKLGKSSKIECKIVKKTSNPLSTLNLPPIHLPNIHLPPLQIPPLLNSEEIQTRRACLKAQRIGRQAVREIEGILKMVDESLHHLPIQNKKIEKGVRVSKGEQKGVVLSSYKRRGRQMRWRIEWDSGERELCYRKDVKVV